MIEGTRSIAWKVLAESILAGCCLFGCAGIDSRPAVTDSPIAPSATSVLTTSSPALTPVTAAPATNAPASTERTNPFRKIAAGVVTGVEWAADSLSLTYSLPEGSWVYDLVAGTASRAGQATSAAATAEVLTVEGAGIKSLGVSPSGSQLIYLVVQTVSPTPTLSATAIDNGESGSAPAAAQLWILTNGTRHRLGQVQDCVGSALWSEDEKGFVLVGLPPPGACLADFGWLADLSADRLVALANPAGEPVTVYGLAPNGMALLIGADRKLAIMDLRTGQLRRLSVETGPYGEWLGNSALVISYRGSPSGSLGLAILDLRTQLITPLPNDSNNPTADGPFWREKLSPDGNWLAVSAGPRTDRMTGLWIARIAR